MCAEKKKYAREFIVANFGDRVSHFWKDMDLVQSRGRCELCTGPCSADFQKQRPDLLAEGAPCQALTNFRVKDGQTPRTAKTPELHPDFECQFSKTEEVIKKTRPLGCIFEQIVAFMQKGRVTGYSFLQEFTDMLRKYYSGVVAILIRADLFVSDVGPCERIYICAMSEELGGADAAQLWGQMMADGKRYCDLSTKNSGLRLVGDVMTRDFFKVRRESIEDSQLCLQVSVLCRR